MEHEINIEFVGGDAFVKIKDLVDLLGNSITSMNTPFDHALKHLMGQMNDLEMDARRKISHGEDDVVVS